MYVVVINRKATIPPSNKNASSSLVHWQIYKFSELRTKKRKKHLAGKY
jgi:hypothetical protein